MEKAALETRSVTHTTFVIERRYPFSSDHVFAAFSDPAKKRRWFHPGEGTQVEEMEMNFRVGGAERKTFHMEQGFVCTNHTIYQDIVPNRRIVFAYTMRVGDHCISSSQGTVELLPEGKQTKLIFTEQAAFFEGADGPQMRQNGWGSLFDQLERHLAQ